MECLQLSVNKEVPKTILQCNNPSRHGNRQSFPRSLASFTFTDPDDLKIQPTSKRIVFPLTNRDFPALVVSLLEPFGDEIDRSLKNQKTMLIGRCLYCYIIFSLESLVVSHVHVSSFPALDLSFERRWETRWKETTVHPGEIEFRLEVISYRTRVLPLHNPFLPQGSKVERIYIAEIEFAK